MIPFFAPCSWGRDVRRKASPIDPSARGDEILREVDRRAAQDVSRDGLCAGGILTSVRTGRLTGLGRVPRCRWCHPVYGLYRLAGGERSESLGAYRVAGRGRPWSD